MYLPVVNLNTSWFKFSAFTVCHWHTNWLFFVHCIFLNILLTPIVKLHKKYTEIAGELSNEET